MKQTEDIFENRIELTELAQAVSDIKTQVGKVIVGQDRSIELLITGLLCDGHVLLEGVPGVAKTLMSKLLAKALAISFKRIQFTPDLMPSDVLGTSIFNPKTLEFEYKAGPVFGNLILIDEINRAPAKTQAALFELMEERQLTIDGKTYLMESPFWVVATQNPIEQEGTYRLPEAQLDRFLLKVKVDYPAPDEELNILKRFNYESSTALTTNIVAVLDKLQIESLRATIRQIMVDENLLKYISMVVQATRNHKAIELGASPRAALALLMVSKATAAIQGRDFVTPEDIKSIGKATLRHRITLTPDAEMEGIIADDILEELFTGIEIPR